MKSEHVAALVAEVLGHGQAGQADPQAGAWRLVHLTEDEDRLVEHARLLHLAPELRPLAGALAHAGEDRVAAVLGGDVADQLRDDDRLADAGAAEDAGLAALGEGGDQVDDLDAGLEDLDLVAWSSNVGAPGGGSGSGRRRSTGPASSIGSPTTLKMRPSVAGPTGTVIGAPVSLHRQPAAQTVGACSSRWRAPSRSRGAAASPAPGRCHRPSVTCSAL